MATEYIQQGYYDDNRSKFIDIHQSIKIAINSFLTTLLLKGDFSRVIYCKDDICFRRRIELVDAEHKDMENIQPINLNLPFANFYQVSDFEDDDRPASVQAAQAISGQYLVDFNRYIRSIAVKAKYKATVFFSRRDDIRMAYQLAHWDQSPKSPIWINNRVYWQKQPLDIPCYITIDNISSHADYKEADWLERSRIFPLDIEMTVRTYEILIPSINRIFQLPIRWGNKWSPETYEEDDEIYIVQEAILVWANKYLGLQSVPSLIDESKPEVKETARRYFSNKEYTRTELEDMCGKIPNYATNDIIEGLWTDTFEVAINRLSVISATDSSLTIECIVKPADYQYFDHLSIYIPGRPEIVSTDPRQTRYFIDGLHARSIYPLKIVTYSKTGILTTFTLRGETLDSPANQAPSPQKTFKRGNSLLGLEF